MHYSPYFYCLFRFSPFSFDCLFLLFFLLLKFYDFQFNHSILISIYNIFQFGPSTFDFLFCSFFHLSKFLCFQFYPSSQFYDFYFFNNNKNFNSVILLLIYWFFFLIFLSQFLWFSILSFKSNLSYIFFQQE